MILIKTGIVFMEKIKEFVIYNVIYKRNGGGFHFFFLLKKNEWFKKFKNQW